MKKILSTIAFLSVFLLLVQSCEAPFTDLHAKPESSEESSSRNLVSEKVTETICFVPLADISELKDEDKVRLTNMHVDNASRLSWYMDSYFPKFKLSRDSDPLNKYSEHFTVRDFNDGTMGLFMWSPYVSMRYFMSGFSGSDVELQQENAGIVNDYKWVINNGTMPGVYTISYANPDVLTPTTMYLYGSYADGRPSLAPPAAGQTQGTNWAIERGMPCTVTFKKNSYWGTGYTGTITITNNGKYAINLWEIEFLFASTIDSISNANIVEKNGRYYKIRHDDWNKTISPGQSRTFHISGVPEEDYDYPYGIIVVTH